MQNPRYKGVLAAKDFASAAKAVQAAGYATDPHYAQQLMTVNDQLSHIKTSDQAMNTPTPDIKGGAPIPQDMEKTPAFHQAITTYAQAREAGVTKSPYVVSIDYSQPATAKRLSVINAETGKVVFQSEVAQGKEGFSNEPGSNQSSLGTFQVTQEFNGKHGDSLKVKGLSKGLNDNAESRAIEVHGADYIGHGKSGHSFGCFAVPSDVAPKLINLIKDGTIIQASAGQATQGFSLASNTTPMSNPQTGEWNLPNTNTPNPGAGYYGPEMNQGLPAQSNMPTVDNMYGDPKDKPAVLTSIKGSKYDPRTGGYVTV